MAEPSSWGTGSKEVWKAAVHETGQKGNLKAAGSTVDSSNLLLWTIDIKSPTVHKSARIKQSKKIWD